MRILLALTLWAAAADRNPNGPALENYRATAEDFRMLESALAGAQKLESRIFPGGIGTFDIIMQDTSDFYLYSRKPWYPYPKVKRWRGYQVYRFPHRRPREHEMWGCAAGPPSAMEMEDVRKIAERTLRCAPWGSFRRAQERKVDGIYRFPEAYLATMLHEMGHLYEDFKSNDPTPRMLAARERGMTEPLPDGVERGRMMREIFAHICELAGSKLLYPAHHKRLLSSAKDGPFREHGVALRIAAEILEKGE